jgi:hypothetical protein
MAKITAVIPEPSLLNIVKTNARQLREALDTQKNELNFGYQKDLRDEQARLEWFFS